MRKLIVEEWISLDGYTSDKNGSLSFFSSIVRDTYTDGSQVKFLETFDCILLGRKTYQQFANLWPGRSTTEDVLAAKINITQKIVFSKTLNEAPWGNWQPAEVKNGSAISRVKELKSVSGRNIVLWGSISLAQLLMKQNLVDEFRIHLCPTITSGGEKFFTEEINPVTLKLTESKHFNTGIVLLHYQYC